MEIFMQTPCKYPVTMVDRICTEGGHLGPDMTSSWMSLEYFGPRATRGWPMRGVHGGHFTWMKNSETPLLITTCHNPRPLTSPTTDPLDLVFHQVQHVLYMYMICTLCTTHDHACTCMSVHKVHTAYTGSSKCSGCLGFVCTSDYKFRQLSWFGTSAGEVHEHVCTCRPQRS